MDNKKTIKLAIDSIVKIALVVCLIVGLAWTLVQTVKAKEKKEALQAARQIQEKVMEAKLINTDRNGVILLKAKDAIIVGEDEIKYNVFKGVENIGWWDHKTQALGWRFTTEEAAKYHVEINYALPASNGTEYEIIAGKSRITGLAPATGGWDVWKTASPENNLKIIAQGEYTLILSATRVSNAGVMNLCYVKLVPLE